jgi:hypothetical protein
MNITSKDIGRKALVNQASRILPGQIVRIEDVKGLDHVIVSSNSGESYIISNHNLKLMSQTLPIEFQVGDVVSYGGLIGKISEIRKESEYPILVNFDPIDDNTMIDTFTLDGRYKYYHTEPLLKFVSRRKKKVKKEVSINAWYSPITGLVLTEENNGVMCRDSQLVKFKGEIEVEE